MVDPQGREVWRSNSEADIVVGSDWQTNGSGGISKAYRIIELITLPSGSPGVVVQSGGAKPQTFSYFRWLESHITQELSRARRQWQIDIVEQRRKEREEYEKRKADQ